MPEIQGYWGNVADIKETFKKHKKGNLSLFVSKEAAIKILNVEIKNGSNSILKNLINKIHSIQ